MDIDIGFAAQACMIVMTASAAALMVLEWYLANRFGATVARRGPVPCRKT